MRFCNNLELIQKIYDIGGAIVITDISHCNIEYLHSILGVTVPITHIQSEEPRCCPSPDYCGCSKPSSNLGYYGIAKGFNGSVNEFYYEVKNCCEKDLNKKILEGVGADETTLWLQMNVKDSKDPFIKTIPEPGVSAKYDVNDLTHLASAQNITFRAETGTDIRYYDPGSWGGRNNAYGINVSVYGCHSQEDNSDYYYVEQEGVYNFSNNYIGQYKYSYEGALSKIEELYCSDLVTDFSLGIDPKYVNIMRLAPQTTEGKTSISSGLSFSLGGGVSFDQNGVKVSVKGGVSVSNSRTITVNAVNVYNKSTDRGSNAKWEYSLKKTESSFSFFSYGQVDLIGASNSGHSTFNPFNQSMLKRFSFDIKQAPSS